MLKKMKIPLSLLIAVLINLQSISFGIPKTASASSQCNQFNSCYSCIVEWTDDWDSCMWSTCGCVTVDEYESQNCRNGAVEYAHCMSLYPEEEFSLDNNKKSLHGSGCNQYESCSNCIDQITSDGDTCIWSACAGCVTADEFDEIGCMDASLMIDQCPEYNPAYDQGLLAGDKCYENYNCKSNHCSNGICCDKGECCKTEPVCSSDKYCDTDSNIFQCIPKLADGSKCTLNYACKSGECKAGKCYSTPPPELIGKNSPENNDVCDYGEDCKSPDCSGSLNCWLEWGCNWGDNNLMAAEVSCIGTMAEDLNKVTQLANIFQNVGCGIFYNFLSGIYEQNVDKLVNAFINIAYTAIDTYKMSAGTTMQITFHFFLCFDGYFGFSKWFLMDAIPKMISVSSSIANEAMTTVFMESPANLIVKDVNGRKAGVDPSGNIYQDIPDSFYLEFKNNDLKMVVLPNSKSEDYTVETEAEEAGEITIRIARSDGKGEVEKISYENIKQDNDTKTVLSFKGKSGTQVPQLAITDGMELKSTKVADEVTTVNVEIPKELRASKSTKSISLDFLKSNGFQLAIFIVLAILGWKFAIKRRRK